MEAPEAGLGDAMDGDGAVWCPQSPAGFPEQLWEGDKGSWCPCVGTSREGQREALILCFCACHHHHGGHGARNSRVAHVLARCPPVAVTPVILAHGVPGLPLSRVHLEDEVGSVETNCRKGDSGESQTIVLSAT